VILLPHAHRRRRTRLEMVLQWLRSGWRSALSHVSQVFSGRRP